MDVLGTAFTFLNRFPQQHHTFQVFKNHKPIDHAYHNSDSQECYAFLEKHLDNEVFFMVNAGDGVTHPGKKTPRSQKSVTTLTACFIDTDSCPIEKVSAYLKSIGLKPHMAIQTSPGKYHIYFLIAPIQANQDSIRRWKAVQEALCYFSNPDRSPTGCDPSMKDFSRVLRVPGFTHEKSGKLSTIVHNSDAPLFTLQNLEKLTDSQSFLSNANTAGLELYTAPTEKLPPGERHYDMAKFLAHLLRRGVSEDLALSSFYGHALRVYAKPEQFLPGGDRHDEVLRFVDYRREQERKEKISEAVSVLDTDIEALDGSSFAFDKFSLPDSFYHELPGLAGEILREVDSRSFIKTPPFVFAATIAALGTLRANSTRTSLGHAPGNYFLCLAPTAGGKNYGIEVYQNTFAALGLTSMLDTRIRSDRGILRFLQKNHGTGMLLTDEAEHFLSMLSDGTAPAHIRGAKSLLLDLYTANNKKGMVFGHVGDTRDKPLALDCPVLNYVGYGVVHSLETAFSLKSIQDGLLQRFVIMTDYRDTVRNPEFLPPKSLNGDLYHALEQQVMSMRLFREKQLLNKNEKEKLQQKILTFTPRAKSKYLSYVDSLMQKRNKEKFSPLSGLYTRAGEQVGRIACSVAEGEITEHLISYLIHFMDSRITALREYCQQNMDTGSHRKNDDRTDLQDLIRFIAHYLQKNQGQAVPKRYITRNFRIRDNKRLSHLLSLGTELNVLDNATQKNGRGSASVVYTLGPETF
jgi:hypothetical protein